MANFGLGTNPRKKELCRQEKWQFTLRVREN